MTAVNHDHLAKMLFLKNPPLVEVIAEIRWKLQEDNLGQLNDSGFMDAVGIINSKLKPILPFRTRRFPENMRVPGFPVFQYRKTENSANGGQVVQHGEGIITINDSNKNYQWPEFELLISKVLEVLEEAYKVSEINLEIDDLRLSYIDTVNIKHSEPKSFIADNLNTNISFGFKEPGKLTEISVGSTFKLNDDTTVIYKVEATPDGNALEGRVLNWHNIVVFRPKGHILHQEVIVNFQKMHNITHQLFKDICTESFYNTFK